MYLQSEHKLPLLQYKVSVKRELTAVLSWWMKYSKDHANGGFYGSVNNNNLPEADAPKGIVLNSRILWAFSAAFLHTRNNSYLEMADRAFDYILHHFIDDEYGGVFWSVDATGAMNDGRKQIYGLAFCMYGMAEYYKATRNKTALQTATDLFALIEQYSLDKERGGYIEAFSREWAAADDLRLSDKDDNEKKTMNTHLHIIEAYANLYTIWPDLNLQQKINDLLGLFSTRFMQNANGHLHLFFDEDWKLKSTLQSFGHDIEAGWLLLKCAEISGNQEYIDQYKKYSISFVNAAAEGLDEDGGLWYEYEPAIQHLIREKHAWPQAEAMIGFYNAWQLTGDDTYLKRSQESFRFILDYLKDRQNGEWYWGVYADYTVMQKEKAGFWKCPYHSARACIEIYDRINKSIQKEIHAI